MRDESRPVRVLLDARIHRPFKTGIGRYIESLGLALARREDVDLTLAVTRGSSGEMLARDHGIAVFYAGHSLRPLFLGSTDFDLFHASYPIIAPAFGVPVLVTVLDLIYDDPRWAGPVKRAAFRALTETLLRTCRGAVAISQATADDLAQRRKPRCFIRVTPMGVAVRDLPPASHRLPDEFLYVGSLRPHKGIAVLLKALDEAPHARLTVLSSESTEQWPRLSKDLSPSTRSRVTFRPFTGDADRQELLATVAAVVVPSHIEGFGLPVIEALAAGTPVVCSDIPVFREVADAYATYFPVGDHLELARVLEAGPPTVVDSDWVLRAQRHAAGFTWDRCASLTVEAYRAALDRQQP